MLCCSPLLLPQTLSLQRNAAGIRHNITCTVRKGTRSASASGFVEARSAALPTVSAAISADVSVGGPLGKVNPSARTLLRGQAQSAYPLERLSVQWVQTGGPSVNLTDTSVAVAANDTSGANGTAPAALLLLKPGALLPGIAYEFTLRATDPGGTASAAVPVVTAGAPRGDDGTPLGSLSAAAAGVAQGSGGAGTAFVTAFTLRATHWLDEDGPLLYQFQYSVTGSESPPVVLAAFSPRATVTAPLPPGLDTHGGAVVLELCAAFLVFATLSLPLFQTSVTLHHLTSGGVAPLAILPDLLVSSRAHSTAWS